LLCLFVVIAGVRLIPTGPNELMHDSDAAHDFAFKALRPQYGTATLVRINDMRGHAAALALFDEVIRGLGCPGLLV
jgi:hypothetical protein